MGTEDSLGFGFHDHLNEIVLDVQCLSLSRVLVLVMTDEHFVSSVLGYRFLLFHPDPCNLGICEYGVGDCLIVHLHFSLEYGVVVDYSRFVVCDVLEQKLAISVSQRPYALLGGLEILVDRNPALRCRLYPRFLWMKNVCYRSSSTGDHDLLCGDRHSLSGLPVQSNELLESRRCPFHLFNFMVGDDVDVPAQHFLCKFRDLRLFVRDKSGVPPLILVFEPLHAEKLPKPRCMYAPP